ncbi:FAD binding domain-containing protein [Lojkania enalia]|uniref:FAD binding domain-containing protein n=1 Tax=Lojkania enalia TaxID=147567 RepID=A0A9P4N1E7_9PLEO|nr:FAD binding domain-containing protein [Didymosphaeria enalia]
MLFPIVLIFSLLPSSLAVNFDYESIQLTEDEAAGWPDVRFAGQGPSPPEQECKYTPEDETWPTSEEWAKFNETLGGVLLKPLPLATPCYAGPNYDEARCRALRTQWASNTSLHANDPTSITSQWSSGYSCVPTSDPNSTCTQGGWPVYVVKASNVRHVQLGVNFARNRNIRVVIKNGGHDFNGKSIGGNSLGIWVSGLKATTYHPNYISPKYRGKAVAYGGGTQAQDLSLLSARNNFTMHIAGGPTVGMAGGYLQGGGHSRNSAQHGLAADNTLLIYAVTADGRFVTASPKENQDLFWAFRGGGGGNYGIITSVIVKAWSTPRSATGTITFSTLPDPGSNTSISTDTFWAGIREYFAFLVPITDAGGLGYDFIRHTPTSSSPDLTFSTSIWLPEKTTSEYQAFVRPLLDRLNALAIPIPAPTTKRSPSHLTPRVLGENIPSALIASRLFQRPNLDNPISISETVSAVRTFVEDGGYTYHGIATSPTLEAGGHPDNAVLPAWRTAVLHAQGYDGNRHWNGASPQLSMADEKRSHDRLMRYMQAWRDITPGSGSYTNEGDAQEPDWKDSFYGPNYGRLEKIKKRWDPWGVFWVISGVGSDGWEVRGSSGGGREGFFTQDGALCRVGWRGK